MDSYFESTLEDVLRWELLEQLGDLTSVNEESPEGNNYVNHRPPKAVYSLQRDYISLYGSHPKMEDRIYSTCGVCEQVFNPQVVANHKEHCPGKGKIQFQQLKKKIKSKKKQQPSSVPLPPLFKKEPPGPPILSKIPDVSPSLTSRLAPDMLLAPEVTSKLEVAEPSPGTSVASPPTAPPLPLPPSPILTEEPPSSSRHKTSKKSTKVREYDPDIHCGVIEGEKGPCTRSITCSNHKIQLRKSVLGRSKNIHVLIAEKKATKEKDSRRHYIFEAEADNADEATGISITPELPENELHDEVESDDPSNQLESGYCSIETSSTKSSPVLYFNPISPIFVVTPVQFIQKENTVFLEAPQRVHSPSPNGFFLKMPEATSNIKLYNSHPKPTIVPTYGTRKVGGAISASNQRLEYQRNDIQMAISTKRMPTSSNCKGVYTVPPQRSILLKTKGINKVSCKRSSTEKLSANDSKQIKLAADVNGFILHTDMSEVAESPQSNHCIQENINLLNMK